MEEKSKETPQNIQEEIKLLQFQPQNRLEEIAKLKDEVSSLKIEKNTLTILVIDLTEEIKVLQKKLPKSFKEIFYDVLLRIFGGQWEEDK